MDLTLLCLRATVIVIPDCSRASLFNGKIKHHTRGILFVLRYAARAQTVAAPYPDVLGMMAFLAIVHSSSRGMTRISSLLGVVVRDPSTDQLFDPALLR